MMPVSLHEQVDEEAAALQFRTIMVRAQSAVQQDKDRSEAEKKFQQLSKGGQFQARDAQQKRKAGYGAAEQAAPVRQRVETMAPGYMVLHPLSLLCIRNWYHLHPVPNVSAIMPRLAQKFFKQHNRCYTCRQSHHPGVRCGAGGQQRNVAHDVLGQLDVRAQGAEAIKRSQKKIAAERSAAASRRFLAQGPRDRNRGRGRAAGRVGHQASAPVQQHGTRGGRGGRGSSRGQSGDAKGGRGARRSTPGPPPPPPGP
jgi:hypothetical protein